MIAVVAERPRIRFLQKPVALASNKVLERIEHRVRDRRDIVIIRIEQCQLVLEHQRARWHRRDERITGAYQRGERRHVLHFQRLDTLEVAELELRHPAAHFALDDDVRHLGVPEQFHEVVPDRRLVVVDVTRRKDRHLARRSRAVANRPLQ